MFTGTFIRRKHVDLGKFVRGIDGPKRVKVGFPAGEASASNINKAIWNNFGTSRGIPPRPFMQNAIAANSRKYLEGMRKAAARILSGEIPLRVVLERLGLAAQADIQGEITSLRSPPNAPSTIRAKGSSNPLIDTGEMRQAVTYKVED